MPASPMPVRRVDMLPRRAAYFRHGLPGNNMKLYAFQGYRYAPAIDPAAQAAPPFDQIDDALRDRLHGQSPHQFARVTKPVAGDQPQAFVEAVRDFLNDVL